MAKSIKINQFTIPEQGNMIVRSRHTKKQFMKLLETKRVSFSSYIDLREFFNN